MYHIHWHQEVLHFVHSVYLWVVPSSYNKQWLFPHTALLMKTKCVLCEAGNKFSHIIQLNFLLEMVKSCYQINTELLGIITQHILCIWRSADRASWWILIIKPTSCTNFSNLFSFLFRAIVYDCKYGPTTCTVLCY